MKLTNITSVILPVIVTGIAHSAILWEGTPNAAYTSGTQISSLGQVGSSWENIGVIASADANANRFQIRNTANGQVLFQNAAALNQGDSITFTFQFNMQLASGPKLYGNTPPARASSMFRINAASSVLDVALQTKVTGGNDTLQNYFGTAPTAGAQSHANPGVLYFNPDTGTESLFSSYAIDRGAIGTDGSTGTPFSTDGSTVTTVSTSTSEQETFNNGGSLIGYTFASVLADSGVDRSTSDFSYDRYEYTITNNSATAIAANTQFLFTFEGANLAAQTAVPEPTSFSLLGLGALGLLARRKR